MTSSSYAHHLIHVENQIEQWTNEHYSLYIQNIIQSQHEQEQVYLYPFFMLMWLCKCHIQIF